MLRQIHGGVVIWLWLLLVGSICPVVFNCCIASVCPAVKLGECCTRTGWHPGVFHLHFDIESFLHQVAEQDS